MKGNIGLLAIIAAGLLVLVVLDRLSGGDPVGGPVDSDAGQSLERVATTTPSTLPQAVLDHPLFQPSRNAVAKGMEAPLEMPLVPEPALPAPEMPTLVGVVVEPAPGGAFLVDPADGQVVYLEPGQIGSGLQLRSVSSDRATFHGADGDVTLLLPTAIELAGP